MCVLCLGLLDLRCPADPVAHQLHHILGLYGCYIIEVRHPHRAAPQAELTRRDLFQRSESEIDQSIFNSSSVHSRSPLALYRDNIAFVEQLVRNDVSCASPPRSPRTPTNLAHVPSHKKDRKSVVWGKSVRRV